MKKERIFLGLICCSLFSAWKIQVILFQILIISLNLNISDICSHVHQCASTSAPCWWPTVANVSAWTLSTSVAGAVTAAPCRNTVQQAAGWTAQPPALGHRSWGWVHSPWWYSVQLPGGCWLDLCDHCLWLQILRVSRWWRSVILAAGLTTLTAVFGLVAFSHVGSWLDHTDCCLWLGGIQSCWQLAWPHWPLSLAAELEGEYAPFGGVHSCCPLAAGLTVLPPAQGHISWRWVPSLECSQSYLPGFTALTPALDSPGGDVPLTRSLCHRQAFILCVKLLMNV